MMRYVQVFGVTLMAGSVLLAQGPPGPGPGPRGRGPAEFGRMMPGRVVTGSPYSAQAVTTHTQTLPDGSTVTHTNTVAEYRDSAGRVREERTVSNVGPWSVQGAAHPTVFISDPVSRTSYTLDPTAKTAHQMAFAGRGPRGGGGNGNGNGNGSAPNATPSSAAVGPRGGRNSQFVTKTDDLGTQMVDGVAAAGTRHTTTIPAGSVGNSNTIQVVEERWYSSDLQMVVMSKHTDPRSGTSTFQMSNISRAEPDASLFTVPPGYTVSQGRGRGPRGPNQ